MGNPWTADYLKVTGENDEGDKGCNSPWNRGNGMKMVQERAQPIAEATGKKKHQMPFSD